MKQPILLLLLSIFASCTQPIETDPIDIKDFFSQLDKLQTDLRAGSHKNGKPFLIDSIHIDMKSILKTIESDTVFDSRDITFIKGQLAADTAGTWKPEIFESIKIVSLLIIDSLRNSNEFEIMPPYLELSKPYFSKDKIYCILYYKYYCGNLCAEATLNLYKKVNGQWSKLKSYYNIVS